MTVESMPLGEAEMAQNRGAPSSPTGDETHPLMKDRAQETNDLHPASLGGDLSTTMCVILDTVSDERVVCTGYRTSTLRWLAFMLGCFLTVGVLPVLCYWKPHWKLRLTCRRCALGLANRVLLRTDTGAFDVQAILPCNLDHPSLLPATQPLEFRSHAFSSCAGNNAISRAIKNGVYPMSLNYFIYRHLRYFYNTDNMCFEHVAGLEDEFLTSELHAMSAGLPPEERARRRVVFGSNTIDVPEKSYLQLFLEEGANPFYAFQLFSCTLWTIDNYYYYAAAIMLTSIISIVISTYQSMTQLRNLRKMIARSDVIETLLKGCVRRKVNSDELVPGDVIIIPSPGCILHCDAALLNGTAIVNESMLTGESTPITKTHLPHTSTGTTGAEEIYGAIRHKRHTLFCGTHILQTRCYGGEDVLAVVTRTGFSTMKGDLIRSILFPKPVDFKFYKDALKFVLVLCFFAILGFAYTCYIYGKEGAAVSEIMIRSLDIFTIAIPPALPAAMSVGTVYALQRLRRKDIFCICPSRINISGKIKLFCFDKTGTLTEDGLDFYGLLQSKDAVFQDLVTDLRELTPDSGPTVCMATCHSLAVIGGELMGDPLDVKMFHSTHWQLKQNVTENGEGKSETSIIVSSPVKSVISVDELDQTSLRPQYEILKQFPFSSELQRMSVIVRQFGGEDVKVFSKGAPEVIAQSCMPSSLPNDFHSTLSGFTAKGYRVLALAYKTLEKSDATSYRQGLGRGAAEQNLTFLGFMMMKNLLKPETAPVIKTLQMANIRVVMVTGDNILTAVNVARECRMVLPDEKIVHVTAVLDSTSSLDLSYSFVGDTKCHHDKVEAEQTADVKSTEQKERIFAVNHYPDGHHFAMDGNSFHLIRQHAPKMMSRFLVSGTVFARMLPNQKAELIMDLQSLGYSVGMCGDGANDCGALKIAQTGISLSEAEASVASPFTSRIPNIQCVPKVIMEGRCSLVTAYSIFKFMAVYSMIQYSSVLLLYYHSANLGDVQFLFIDLFVITPFAVTLSYSGPYHRLVPKRPLGSLIHPLVIVSLILQILLQFGIQFAAFLYVQSMSFFKSVEWFKEHDRDIHSGTTQIKSTINSTVFLVSSFQYIIMAVVFSISKPYRESLLKNKGFLFCVVALTAFAFTLVFAPAAPLRKFFHLVDVADNWFWGTMVMLVTCHALLAYLIERQLSLSESFRRLLNRIRRKRDYKNIYKHVLRDMGNDPHWPPLATSDAETNSADNKLAVVNS